MAESADFFDDLETRGPEVREEALIAAVSEQIAHAKANAPYFRKLLKGVEPGVIKRREDLAALPVTRKSELIKLQRKYPAFGGLATIEPREAASLFCSPGPIFEFCAAQADAWGAARALFAAGFRRGDIVHNSFSYHMTPGAWVIDSAARALGCAVIPAGVGNTAQQAEVVGHFRPTCFAGIPDFLATLLDAAAERNIDASSITKALVSGGPLFPAMRKNLKARGISVLQAYATADLGNIAHETPALEGMVVNEDRLLEIVRPGTGDPVPEGEVGEVVVTTLDPSYPLIRFGTGDLSAILPGTSPCGRTNMRIKGWMGRADQTTKIRGMFVYPEQVAEVLKRHPEILKARLVVDEVEGKDSATLHCEAESGNEALIAAIGESFRNACKVRGEVLVVAPGSLANDDKVIEDVRKFD